MACKAQARHDVGDTTGAEHNPVRPFSIGLGFVADIPYARSLNPYTHTDWEGTGVIPDIPIAADSALKRQRKPYLPDGSKCQPPMGHRQNGKIDSLPNGQRRMILSR